MKSVTPVVDALPGDGKTGCHPSEGWRGLDKLNGEAPAARFECRRQPAWATANDDDIDSSLYVGVSSSLAHRLEGIGT